MRYIWGGDVDQAHLLGIFVVRHCTLHFEGWGCSGTCLSYELELHILYMRNETGLLDNMEMRLRNNSPARPYSRSSGSPAYSLPLRVPEGTRPPAFSFPHKYHRKSGL